MNLSDFDISLVAAPFCVLTRKFDAFVLPCSFEKHGLVTFFNPLVPGFAPFNDSYSVKLWLNETCTQQDIYVRSVNGGFFANKSAKILHTPLDGIVMGQLYVDHHNLTTGECVGSIPVQVIIDPTQVEIIEHLDG